MNISHSEIFARFESLIFFKSITFEKTYFDFQQDIFNQSAILEKQHYNNCKVVVKNNDPYIFLVDIFALWRLKKTPVLISCKAPLYSEQMLLEQIPLDENEVENEALILFTSGTTDLPKGVSLTFSNLEFQAETFIKYFNSSPEEIYLLNLPLHHVGGLMLCLRSFYSGGCISTKESAPFSYISLVPHQLNRWITEPELLTSLAQARAILVGGATLHKSLKIQAKKLKLPIYETYGMTETASFITINGKLLPNREMQISSNSIISIKGPMVAAGHYINQKFIKFPEWLQTNDLGLVDCNNFFSFKGRQCSILISGGENISSLEIETAVLSIPEIKEAHIVGIPDEKWGDLIALLYESTEDKDKDKEIKNHLLDCLHPYHLPKIIFKTSFHHSSEMKFSQKEINSLAHELFLKEIFSYSYIFLAEDRPTIVILHGFMENKDDWNFLIPILKNNYNLLLIDLPGHGDTDTTHFSSLHEIFRRLSDFISLFSNNPILIGYSMGGRIALNLSENYLVPQKLILISASLGLETKLEQEARLEDDLKLFSKINESYSMEQFFIDWYSNPIFLPYFQSEIFRQDIEKKIRINYKQWEAALKFFSQGIFPLKKKFNFNYPLAYFSGSEDKKYSSSEITPHFVISGAGHNPHKTHSQELIQGLLKIL